MLLHAHDDFTWSGTPNQITLSCSLNTAQTRVCVLLQCPRAPPPPKGPQHIDDLSSRTSFPARFSRASARRRLVSGIITNVSSNTSFCNTPTKTSKLWEHGEGCVSNSSCQLFTHLPRFRWGGTQAGLCTRDYCWVVCAGGCVCVWGGVVCDCVCVCGTPAS